MKLLPLILVLIFFISCETTGGNVKKSEPKKPVKKIATGWTDRDTYTVKVTGDNEADAIDKAKNKILRNIVNVRVMKSSPFTDIRKIQLEFKRPLENGKVIRQCENDGKVTIYYQIHGKDLKAKFMRR